MFTCRARLVPMIVSFKCPVAIKAIQITSTACTHLLEFMNIKTADTYLSLPYCEEYPITPETHCSSSVIKVKLLHKIMQQSNCVKYTISKEKHIRWRSLHMSGRF